MPDLGIALCPRCRRDTLPQLAQPSWHREKHRATADERDPEPSVAALKAARKKERAALRKQVKVGGILAAAKFYLSLKDHAQPEGRPLMLDCEDCLKLQHEKTAA